MQLHRFAIIDLILELVKNQVILAANNARTVYRGIDSTWDFQSQKWQTVSGGSAVKFSVSSVLFCGKLKVCRTYVL